MHTHTHTHTHTSANTRRSGETLLRKLGRADMVRKQSVPEIVFAYFHNK